MKEIDFQASVSAAADGVTIRCDGEIDIASIETLAHEVDRGLEIATETLHIDLSGTTFFSGVGAELLLDTAFRCEASGVRIRVTASNPVLRVLDLVGLAWLVDRRATSGERHCHNVVLPSRA